MNLHNTIKAFTYYIIDRRRKYKMSKLAQNMIAQWLTTKDALSSSEINAARVYWEKYVKKFSPSAHIFYSSRNGIFDVRYIPDYIFYSHIDPYFNNWTRAKEIDDKNYYSLLFHDVRQPVTVIRKMNNILCDDNYHFISIDKAYELCKKNKKIIFKPSLYSQSGDGIFFWQAEDGDEKLRSIINNLKGDVIAQQVLSQHETLSKLHKNSVNTVRTISLIYNNRVNILSSIFRMGINGSMLDNASKGGITCGIQDNGQLKSVAYTVNGIKYEKHPQGANFSDYVVPSYKIIKNMTVKLHERVSYFKLVSWDFAVDIDGSPVLLEVNLYYNGLEIHQLNNGPLFGNMTDEILNDIFIHSR